MNDKPAFKSITEIFEFSDANPVHTEKPKLPPRLKKILDHFRVFNPRRAAPTAEEIKHREKGAKVYRAGMTRMQLRNWRKLSGMTKAPKVADWQTDQLIAVGRLPKSARRKPIPALPKTGKPRFTPFWVVWQLAPLAKRT